MAEKDVVRITFKEIQSIADTPKEDFQEDETQPGDANKNKKKRSKRPEQAIYRPGQLRGNGSTSKKEKDASNSEEWASGSVPLEHENWELEVEEAARAKEGAGTTDEESSRGSKENSVEKEWGGAGGRDTARFTPSPSSTASHKGEGGRRRSKRPDIQIYVPKGRIQEEHDVQDGEEGGEFCGGAGADVEIPCLPDAPDTAASPRKIDLNSRLGALQVTVVGGCEPPAESDLPQRPPPSNSAPSSTPDPLATPQQQARQTPPPSRQKGGGGGNNKAEQSKTQQEGRDAVWERQSSQKGDARKRDSDQHQDSRDRKKETDQHLDRRDRKRDPVPHQDGRDKKKDPDQHQDSRDRKREPDNQLPGSRWDRDSNATWRENRGRGRHSEDRDSVYRGGGRGGGARRGSEDLDKAGAGGGGGGPPGRGRGRGRHHRQLQNHRSSSSESLSKSVDLGHRAQWPGGDTPAPFASGTFPRSKGHKNRSGAEEDPKDDADLAQEGGGRHAFSSMRLPRERTGSISSDTSAGSGGSDLSWEDLEAEFEREKPDWNTQVEQYLEEVARQVQDSTQRLTDDIDNSFHTGGTPTAADNPQQPRPNQAQPGLSRNLSASSDRIFTQEYRGRKKDRRRRGSRSKNSSRDSSIHSNRSQRIGGSGGGGSGGGDDDYWPSSSEEKRSHRRRNRRRPSSAGPGNRVGTVEGQRAAESLRIMVGKNKERRQVMVGGGDGGRGGGGGQRGGGFEQREGGGGVGVGLKGGEEQRGGGEGDRHRGGFELRGGGGRQKGGGEGEEQRGGFEQRGGGQKGVGVDEQRRQRLLSGSSDPSLKKKTEPDHPRHRRGDAGGSSKAGRDGGGGGGSSRGGGQGHQGHAGQGHPGGQGGQGHQQEGHGTERRRKHNSGSQRSVPGEGEDQPPPPGRGQGQYQDSRGQGQYQDNNHRKGHHPQSTSINNNPPSQQQQHQQQPQQQQQHQQDSGGNSRSHFNRDPPQPPHTSFSRLATSSPGGGGGGGGGRSNNAGSPDVSYSSSPPPPPPSSSSHAGGLIKLPSSAPDHPPAAGDRSNFSNNPGVRGGGGGGSVQRPDHGPTPHGGQDWRGQGHQGHHYHPGGQQDWGQGYSNSPDHSEERFRRNSQGQGGGGGAGPQGQGERRLYDHKNPSKPIVVPDARGSALKFQDTDDGAAHSASPQETFTFTPPSPHPSHLSSHPPGPHSPQAGSPVGGVQQQQQPSFPPFFPPHPGYMYPHPHMRMAFPPGYGPPPPPPPPNHPMFYGFQPPARQPMDADEAYYNRELETVVSGMSRPQCRLMAEQVLRDTGPLDVQLTNILSRGQLGDDTQRRIKQLRHELQRRYQRVLLLDVDVASQRGVEQLLWRSVYYNIIEGIRRQQAPDASTQAAANKLIMADILEEGTSFYEGLLGKLETTYGFTLEAALEEGGGGGLEGAGRGVRLAVLSAQRTMMFLGDIARYKEQAAHSTNYGKARHWYLKAQKLAPKNGRPYNQLAILAMYTRRKLDAVYYYQRSLAASNPILTARESLMSLFDDVRRKEEAVEQKRLEEARRRRRRKATPSHSQARVELWVAPDGSSSRDQLSDRESDNDDLSGLSSIELNKRFVLTFLNVHGKLFTKINFEVFVESGSLMLQEWKLLLHHSPTVLTASRLVQISAINMFSIDNTALKDESLEASCRSLLQEHAVEVGLDMFGLLTARVNHLLTSHLAQGSRPHLPLSDDLQQLLPGVKVWVDWMMCHSALWNPQPSLRPPEFGPQIDVWKSVAELCNTLKQVDTSLVSLHRDKREGCEGLPLMEDSMLSGFVPLLSAPVDTVYINVADDKEAARDCLRLEKVVLFGEYLCGIEPPMLSFNVGKGRYYSVAPQPVKSEESLGGLDADLGMETEDVIVESEESGEDGDETPGETIKELKARKAELRQRVEDQARHRHTLQTLVEKGCTAKLELEVRPRFLVTDTNCFIDHLTSLRSIVHTATYTLVVPLVVLNELEGLAKGTARDPRRDLDDSPEHVTLVTRHAKQALGYLEAEFKVKNSHLRVQTSKGSVLETLAFRSEESDNSGNNDDLILSCCLHYCKDMARDFMPKDKDSPVRLFRDVVLLTDDRNLRLKAHTSNVPAKDVPAFCRWAKVT